MELIVEGQFDDADEDFSDQYSTKFNKTENTTIENTENLNNLNNYDEDVCSNDNEENDDFVNSLESNSDDFDSGNDLSLETVEWRHQTTSITKQYHQFTGKLSLGNNPQSSSKDNFESVVKKFQNKLYLGSYCAEAGKSFRKADDYSTKSRDKSDQATLEKALDRRTMMILYKMLSKVYSGINGCVSTGKEANVYHALSVDGQRNLAVKVFKTVASEFRNRDQYMAGEYRFRYNTCTKNIRKLVPKWAEKEFRNLHRIYKAGILSPEPICLHGNVLVMEFLGEDGRPAPRLKDTALNSDQLESMYLDCVKMMRKMFQQCKLVHADLSEFNLLVFSNKLYVIDVSQSVEMDNENALKFLHMDVKNVTNYFRKQGVITMMCRDLCDFVMNVDINDEDLYIKDALKKALDNNDDQDGDDMLGNQMEVLKVADEYHESFAKDLRRQNDGGTRQIIQVKHVERNDNNDESDNVEDSDSNEDDDSDTNIGSQVDNKDDKEHEISECQKIYNRPRDESPNSKKDRKKAVKEVQRTNRMNKIPKSEKKRRIKISKNKKS